jgi:hypothetical protein
MDPENKERHDFESGHTAVLDQEKCRIFVFKQRKKGGKHYAERRRNRTERSRTWNR